MKYTKIFKTTGEYKAYVASGAQYPNISLCEDTTQVQFNPLYAVVLTNLFPYDATTMPTSEVKINFVAPAGTDTDTTAVVTALKEGLEISLDGVNWSKWFDDPTGGTSKVWQEITLKDYKEKLYIRGKGIERFTGVDTVTTPGTTVLYNSQIKVTRTTAAANHCVSVGGNINGLLDYTKTIDTLPGTTGYTFYKLFNGQTEIVDEYFVDPSAPATSAKYATELKFPATALVDACYASIFDGCTGITLQPILPAYVIKPSCYSGMFNGCTALTSTNVHGNPAYLMSKEYQIGCYANMYQGCTALTASPELRGETLVENCFKEMFKGCTSLVAITCLATDNSAANCTKDWVSGIDTVVTAGTFTKSKDMTKWTTGPDGIPTGWTVVDKA